MFLCVDLQTCRTCCESTLSFNSGLRVALFVSGMSAFKLSIPCFIVLPIVFFTLANWELGRESDKTEDGLPIAVDVVMLIFVLILSFFVSLALFFYNNSDWLCRFRFICFNGKFADSWFTHRFSIRFAIFTARYNCDEYVYWGI